MKSMNKEIEILNDLLRINNDRIEGYHTAVEAIDDTDLRKTFIDMAGVSMAMTKSLESKISALGGKADVDSTTNAGKIYRAWMEVKDAFSGKDNETALKSCEFGEDAAQKAYDAALENPLSESVRNLIMMQRRTLNGCHNLIKSKRDELIAMN